MSTFPYPKVVPSSSVLSWNAAVNVFRSPWGAVKTQSRGGDTLSLLHTHANRTGADRRAIDAFLSQMRGMGNRCVARDYSYSQQGSLSAPELLPDPEMAAVSTYYNSGSNIDERASSAGLRYLQTASPYNYVRPIPVAQTVVSGLAYAFVVDFAGGNVPNGTVTQQARLGSADSLADVGLGETAAGVSSGRVVAHGVAAATSLYLAIAPSGNDVGQFVDVARASFARCLIVDGAGQVGSQLNVSRLDDDTPGQLLAGDQVEIDGHLKILTADLDGGTSGLGVMKFYPPISTAPADGGAVIIQKPNGTFMLAQNENSRQNVPGNFSNYTIGFVEDYSA